MFIWNKVDFQCSGSIVIFTHGRVSYILRWARQELLSPLDRSGNQGQENLRNCPRVQLGLLCDFQTHILYTAMVSSSHCNTLPRNPDDLVLFSDYFPDYYFMDNTLKKLVVSV